MFDVETPTVMDIEDFNSIKYEVCYVWQKLVGTTMQK